MNKVGANRVLMGPLLIVVFGCFTLGYWGAVLLARWWAQRRRPAVDAPNTRMVAK